MPIGNPNCWEKLDFNFCGLLTKPLEAIQAPFESYFGTWFLVIIWGLFISILWIRSQNPMLVGIVGVIIAGTIPALNSKAIGIGILLVGISIAVAIYQLYQQRTTYPMT